jgi:hypothetical protein
MNTLLARVEHPTSVWKQNVSQYISHFKNKGGMFLGSHKTYVPREGQADDPTKQGTVRVASTVTEQFDWMKEHSLIPYLNQLFSVEATNSKGANTVELKVDGVVFGNLSALELMRLKSILTDPNFLEMLKNIPVRSDARVWEPTTNKDYEGREIWQTPRQNSVAKTTVTEDIILKDPNLDPAHLPSNYRAQVTQVKKTVKTGDYTTQFFTGEWTHQQRANLLKRRSELIDAINIALQKVNDREATECRVDNLFKHLIYG